MAQTAANLAGIAKQVYTQNELEKQFYTEAPILDRFEKTSRYTVGREAVVPIWSYNGNGTTVLGAGGGTFNPDDAQDTQVAKYTLSYVWQPIGLEFGALNEIGGGNASVGDALTLEIDGAVDGLRRQAMRISGGSGDGLIAGCLTSTTTTTINLDPAKRGSHAVSAGFLSPGITVDIGDSPNGQSVATSRLITDVIESDTAPQIVINGANISTATSNWVTLSHPTGAPSEFAGLRAFAGTSGNTVGQLDPTTAGKRFWNPAFVDSTTTVYGLDLPLKLQRKVRAKTRKSPSWFVCGLKPAADHYALLQTQVHFGGDMNLTAGADQKAGWNGMEFSPDPDIPDNEMYLLDPDSFLIVTGKYSKPIWKSDVQGVNTGLDSVIGASGFKDALVYAFALACRRRNANAAAQALA